MNRTYCVRLGGFVNNDRAGSCQAFLGRYPDSPVYCGACRFSGPCNANGTPTSVAVDRAKEFAPSNSLDFWGLV